MNPHALLSVALLFGVPSIAEAVILSGTVTDLSGNILYGAGISLVEATGSSNTNNTSTNTSGAWSIPAKPAGIVIQPKPRLAMATNHLVLEGNRICLRFDGGDAAGRMSSGAGAIGESSSKKTTRTEVAARSMIATADTLLYSWNGRVRARVGIASLFAGNLGKQAIDTSTWSTDIPWNSSITYGRLIDTRDGQVYKTVTIGTQTWMAQNLNYAIDSFADGWPCRSSGADSCVKYGRFYKWAAVMDTSTTYNTTLLSATLPFQGICPTGWHVPSDAEWTKLADTSISSPTADTFLISRGWVSVLGTDIYGFRILPAGWRFTDGSVNFVGNHAGFYSSSEFSASYARYRQFGYGVYNNREINYKNESYSLRCIEN
jgi:uncharacterized protein (TIGR02145 family)